MSKKILAAAVAAALVAPLAAVQANPVVYGKVHVSLDNTDIDFPSTYSAGERTGDGWDLVSRQTRLGVKGSEDLGNGLKAIYQLEFEICATDSQANDNRNCKSDEKIADGDAGTIKMRNTFVGLNGSWGTFLAGRHDTPMKMSTGKLDVFGDEAGDYNTLAGHAGYTTTTQFISGIDDLRADNALAYVSPAFNNLTFAGAIVPAGDSTATGAADGRADDLVEGYSVALMYNGPVYASLAYERLNEEMLKPGGAATFDSDLSRWRVGLGWDGGSAMPLKVGVVYERDRLDYAGGSDMKARTWVANAAYTFGNNVVKAQYANDRTKFSGSSFTERSRGWALGLDHNFSQRTKAYVQYADYDYKTSGYSHEHDWDTFSIGMRHDF